MQANKSFSMFLPISVEETKKSNQKSDDTDKYWTIAGWASTPTIDIAGESIDAFGIDDAYFKQYGWIDYEHDTQNVIGVPTPNTFTDVNRGLFLEAKLFKSKPEVQELMRLYDNIQDLDMDRKLGFSIEGKVQERDATNENIIRSVWITGVAVTKNPANPEATWESIQKSNMIAQKDAFTTGYGTTPETQVDSGALRPEDLAGAITSMSYALSLPEEELEDLRSNTLNVLDGRPNNSQATKELALQLFTGLSAKDAKSIFEKE